MKDSVYNQMISSSFKDSVLPKLIFLMIRLYLGSTSSGGHIDGSICTGQEARQERPSHFIACDKDWDKVQIKIKF